MFIVQFSFVIHSVFYKLIRKNVGDHLGLSVCLRPPRLGYMPACKGVDPRRELLAFLFVNQFFKVDSETARSMFTLFSSVWLFIVSFIN